MFAIYGLNMGLAAMTYLNALRVKYTPCDG